MLVNRLFRHLDTDPRRDGSPDSGLIRVPRHVLQPSSVALPPPHVAWRHVVAFPPQPDHSVNELPDNISMTSVAVRLGNYEYQHPVERDRSPLLRPPWHVTDSVQGQGI